MVCEDINLCRKREVLSRQASRLITIYVNIPNVTRMRHGAIKFAGFPGCITILQNQKSQICYTEH